MISNNYQLNNQLRRRILFIAPSAYPLGGIATWLDYLIPGLRRGGWKVLLGLTAGRFHDIDQYLAVHPIDNIIEIENRTGTREGRVRSLYRNIFRSKPDVVVGVNSPDTYMAIERLRVRKGFCPKAVMTLHGIEPDLYEDAREFRGVLDAVICTNQLSCRLLEEDAKLSPDRIYYAPYGVDIPQERKHFSSNEKPLSIAYCGRLDSFQKRADDIPKILGQLDRKRIKYKFMIAGGGPGENVLKESLSSLGQSNKIKFLGVLSYNDLVDQVYHNVDVLLLTSSWETGPIVVWEAMAHGIAVVTSTYVGSGIEGSLKDGENCLMFPVGDKNKAADCIEALADSELRKEMAQSAYNLVTNRYSHERSIENWDRCFREICLLPRKEHIQKKQSLPPAGRLDCLLGTSMAESIRIMLGRNYNHDTPGGEWPHSYGIRQKDDKAFWQMASTLDQINL
jgi:glycosyltransferase involved in cell wall biosynthesis